MKVEQKRQKIAFDWLKLIQEKAKQERRMSWSIDIKVDQIAQRERVIFDPGIRILLINVQPLMDQIPIPLSNNYILLNGTHMLDRQWPPPHPLYVRRQYKMRKMPSQVGVNELPQINTVLTSCRINKQLITLKLWNSSDRWSQSRIIIVIFNIRIFLAHMFLLIHRLMLMRPVTLQNLHWQCGMSPRSWGHLTNPRRVWSLQPHKQKYANDNEDSSATSVFLSRWTTLPNNFKSPNHDCRSNTYWSCTPTRCN